MTKELYFWLPCRPPVYKLFRDKPGSVVHYYNYTCIFVVTRYALNSAVRRKHPERCWFLVTLRQPGKRPHKVTENKLQSQWLCCWCDAWIKSHTRVHNQDVLAYCLAFGQSIDVKNVQIKNLKNVKNVTKIKKTFVNVMKNVTSSQCSSTPGTIPKKWPSRQLGICYSV